MGPVAHFQNPGDGFVFPAACFEPTAGTLAFWFRSDDAQSTTALPLMGVGQNNPGWFQISLEKGNLLWLYKHGRSPYTDATSCYNSLKTPLGESPTKDGWHHVAAAWATLDSGHALFRIYVNGKPVLTHSDLRIAPSFPRAPLVVGRSSAQARVPYRGAIDQVHASNVPRTAQEIDQLYQAQLTGQKTLVDAYTLFYSDFNGTSLTGSCAAYGPGDAQAIRQRVGKILQHQPTQP